MNIRKFEDHSQTTKLHFKLYKAGKLWLVGAIASGVLVAGLSVSTTANAATNEDGDDAAEVADSGTVTAKSVKLVTSSAAPATSTAEPAHSVAAPATPTAEPAHSVASPAPSAAEPAHSVASLASSAAEPAHSVASLGSSVAEPTPAFAAPMALSAIAPLPASDPTIQTDSDSDGKPIAGTTISTVPSLGNFYVNVGDSNVIPYDSKAYVGLVPYDAENMNTFPQDVFGFYVVLPASITAKLTDVQDAADAYVSALKADVDSDGKPYVSIDTLKVYRLENTKDGRYVFYFQPNKGASFQKKPLNSTGTDKRTGYGSQVHMYTLVSTANSDDEGPEPTSVVINNPNGKNGEIPTSDILFMGIGDQTYPGGNDYQAYSATDISGTSDWPDDNVVGIYADNGAKTLTYVNISIAEKYTIRVADTNATIIGNTKFLPDSVSTKPGTTYNPSDYLTHAFLSSKLSHSAYWYPSIQYVGNSTNPTPQTLPDTVTLEPSKLDMTDSTTGSDITGNIFTFQVSRIKTKLSATNATYYAGTTNAWKPEDTLGGTAPDGTELDVAQAIKGNTPTLGSIVMTITDQNGKTVQTTELNISGTYTVTYKYDDAQGNTSSATSTITVKPAASTLTVADQAITAGTKWTPTDAITGQTAVDGTAITTPSMGTAADGSKLAVTITDSDNNTIDPATFDASTPGTYTLTYTYTDANGNVVTPDAVTLTVNPRSIPDNGGNTTTGNTGTDNPATDPGSTGTGTTKPGKPTMPSKPTTPTKPILKAVHAPQVTPVPKQLVEHPMAKGTAPAKGVQPTGGHAMTTVGQLAKNDTLPQTGEQNTPWLTELGLVLLALSQTLVVRRKQD
ncbi:hypothetical protein IV54_GL000824 [Levilactobacillus paucivorans]|uniref:Gram-positive cocci surface proteins LPxTG domain-containing protein n=1 Tax=Levilactobacillus paucivorans TaxID=616990 RepID=A0A0R2LT69_9LACO|nr:KxYKxGKxW signal peptide domain-containing protein [Levilactobacillus paucivorans]KRO04799.1 hypothetical protein IV54_GL000824 [Levilactobacillus paucivorans]